MSPTPEPRADGAGVWSWAEGDYDVERSIWPPVTAAAAAPDGGLSMTDTTSAYESLKDDLGYLQLGRAAECFATLAEQAKAEEWSHVEFLARVIAEQAAATTNRRLAARLRYARFPYRRTIEDFDFDFQPSVDRKLVADLASLRFISEGRSIAFLGQPGCGKTHLAVALATRAVEAGYRGYFTTADDMVVTLGRARAEGTWTTKLRTYTAPTVLVVDDVGLLPMGRGAAAASSTSSTTATRNTPPPWSPPTAACPAGARSSATTSSPPPCSTGSCTGRWCSTSGAPWRMREHQALETATNQLR